MKSAKINYIYCGLKEKEISLCDRHPKATDILKSNRIHVSSSERFNDPLDNAYKAPFTANWLGRSKAAHILDVLKSLIRNIDSEIDARFLITLSSYNLSSHYSPLVLVTLEEIIASICNDIPAKPIDPALIVQRINAYLRSKNPSVSNNLRIACFSTINNSVPMWGYYGGNHRGMCIEFDISLLPEDYPQKDELLRSLRKVEYRQDRPKDDFSITSCTPYIKRRRMGT